MTPRCVCVLRAAGQSSFVVSIGDLRQRAFGTRTRQAVRSYYLILAAGEVLCSRYRMRLGTWEYPLPTLAREPRAARAGIGDRHEIEALAYTILLTPSAIHSGLRATRDVAAA